MEKRRPALAHPTKTPNIETTSRAVTDERSATARLFVTDRFATTAQIAGAFFIYSNHQNSWQKFVGSNHARLRVVVGGRQSACILRLALRDFSSPPFLS